VAVVAVEAADAAVAAGAVPVVVAVGAPPVVAVAAAAGVVVLAAGPVPAAAAARAAAYVGVAASVFAARLVEVALYVHGFVLPGCYLRAVAYLPVFQQGLPCFYSHLHALAMTWLLHVRGGQTACRQPCS